VYSTIGVVPVTPVIGAVVTGVDLGAPVPDVQRAELHDALTRHLVLFFRGHDLTDEQHIAFASNFGEPNVFPTTRARGLDEPLEWIEDGPDSPPKTDLWHTDVAFLAAPPDVAVLSMRATPDAGGDTLWASLYAAYDGLSPVMQELIADLEQDLHPGPNFEATTTMMFGAEVYRRVADEFRGARHPLVRVHPVTSRPALYLCGAYVRGIAGLHEDESDALLGFLRSRLHDPNLQCRWRWQEHDVVVWDERCTNHRALSDHFPARRVVRRCTVGAGVPVGRRAIRASVAEPVSGGAASEFLGDSRGI
jgi:taurine dioxygenase